MQKILNNRADKTKSDLLKLRILIQAIFKRARISRMIPYDPAENLMIPAAKKEPNKPVFTQPTTGKRHTKTSMDCLWGNFKRELDISLGVKVHRNQIVAKSLMGHSDIKMTPNVYTDTTFIVCKKRCEKINIFLKKVKEKQKNII